MNKIIISRQYHQCRNPWLQELLSSLTNYKETTDYGYQGSAPIRLPSQSGRKLVIPCSPNRARWERRLSPEGSIMNMVKIKRQSLMTMESHRRNDQYPRGTDSWRAEFYHRWQACLSLLGFWLSGVPSKVLSVSADDGHGVKQRSWNYQDAI